MELHVVNSEIQTHFDETEQDGLSTAFLEDQVEKFSEKENVQPSEKTAILDKLEAFVDRNFDRIILIGKIILFLGYLVYFRFAVAYHVGDEPSWRLIGCTILGVWILGWNLFKQTSCFSYLTTFLENILTECLKGRRNLVFRWILYVTMMIFMTVYVIYYVAIKTPGNLQSLIGLFGFPFLLFLTSKNRRKINWHTVYWSMALQFIIALLVLKTTWGASILRWCGHRLEEFVENAKAGSIFVFGVKYIDHPFVFKAVVRACAIIVGISVLSYLGVIKCIGNTVGKALAFSIGTSPAEGINAVGNIFLFVPESVMLVQEYLADMTPSQLFVTYAGALSTVGGVSLIFFMSLGVPAAPLIAASTMSAPASIAAAKLSFPSHDGEEVPVVKSDGKSTQKSQILRHPTSLMDSIMLGVNQCVALVGHAIMFIMIFIIILEFLNNTFIWFGDRIGVEDMSVKFLFSYIFYPFAFMMGAKPEDCSLIGELLGIRTSSFAVVAFPKLGAVIQNGLAFRAYTAESVNNTWTMSGDDIILDNLNKTLVGGVIDERSEIIATYALCGSASFTIMGWIIGAYEVMLPHRIKEITQHMLRAMIVGTVASYLTACFAGLLFEEEISNYD